MLDKDTVKETINLFVYEIVFKRSDMKVVFPNRSQTNLAVLKGFKFGLKMWK